MSLSRAEFQEHLSTIQSAIRTAGASLRRGLSDEETEPIHKALLSASTAVAALVEEVNDPSVGSPAPERNADTTALEQLLEEANASNVKLGADLKAANDRIAALERTQALPAPSAPPAAVTLDDKTVETSQQ